MVTRYQRLYTAYTNNLELKKIIEAELAEQTAQFVRCTRRFRFFGFDTRTDGFKEIKAQIGALSTIGRLRAAYGSAAGPIALRNVGA